MIPATADARRCRHFDASVRHLARLRGAPGDRVGGARRSLPAIRIARGVFSPSGGSPSQACPLRYSPALESASASDFSASALGPATARPTSAEAPDTAKGCCCSAAHVSQRDQNTPNPEGVLARIAVAASRLCPVECQSSGGRARRQRATVPLGLPGPMDFWRHPCSKEALLRPLSGSWSSFGPWGPWVAGTHGL